jgi:hypothetical protein
VNGPPGRVIRITATLVSVAYAVVLAVSGIHLQTAAKQVVAYIPTAIGLGLVLFDKVAWRWPGIHMFSGRPRIDGTWRGTLIPNPESKIPGGGNRGPIDAAVLVTQTYWTLHVTLMTAESSSDSTVATIRRVGESRSRSRLTYAYLNEPRQEHRPRSNPHGGATTLDRTGRLPDQMTGAYWTDRLTAGDMTLTRLTRDTGFNTLKEVNEAFPRS